MFMTEKLIVGKEEWCSLHDMGIPAIRARVDSGAKTSSLHAFNIQPFTRDGRDWVSFEVHPLQHNRSVVIRHESPVIERRAVKNTGGISDKRYVIRETMTLGESSWDIELTLANRDSMGYRMLLGREAMTGRVLIDPEGSMHMARYSKKQIAQLYRNQIQQQAGLRIAVLSFGESIYTTERLMEAIAERGHQASFIDLTRCALKLDNDQSGVLDAAGELIDGLDAVIPRIPPHLLPQGLRVLRQFELGGVAVLNSAEAIAATTDKLQSLQRCASAGMDIPTTLTANDAAMVPELIRQAGQSPVMIKLNQGSQGRGVILGEHPRSAATLIQTLHQNNQPWMVQRHLPSASEADLRVLVIRGKAICGIIRQSAHDEYRSNLHRGGSARLARLSGSEKKLAILASKTLRLDVAGVDLVRDVSGTLLLEVNAFPGLNSLEDATGKDVAGLLVQSLERKLKWKRSLATEVADDSEE